jgi:hypothetical protein
LSDAVSALRSNATPPVPPVPSRPASTTVPAQLRTRIAPAIDTVAFWSATTATLFATRWKSP